MSTLNELIILGAQNEHDLEHDLEHTSLFSKPKIYDADGDLTKRWYVYFSYLDPVSGKLKRVKNFYGKANRYNTKESRYALLSLYRNRLIKLLNEGYNPFLDNTELFQKKKTEKQSNISEVSSIPKFEQQGITPTPQHTTPQHTTPQHNTQHPENTNTVSINRENNKDTILNIEDAFALAIKLKTNIINQRTLNDYKNRCDIFQRWLKEHHKHIFKINQIDKKLVSQFLNEIQLKTSSRNRNNYRGCFSSIFQLLEDNDHIPKNFVKAIKPLKTTPKRNKTYSEKEQVEIFTYLETADPILLLFIKFISYNFLRPIEVCRLKVKDIDLESKTLQFQAKNKILKTKIIPEILIKDLPDLSLLNANSLLFTPDKIGGEWDTELNNRRDYFSKRFKSVVKDHFNLGLNHGLYSFRHTFITKLYKALVIISTPYAAKSSLMQITGHATMDALEKYLRDIDAELPKDYSSLLNKLQ